MTWLCLYQINKGRTLLLFFFFFSHDSGRILTSFFFMMKFCTEVTQKKSCVKDAKDDSGENAPKWPNLEEMCIPSHHI